MVDAASDTMVDTASDTMVDTASDTMVDTASDTTVDTASDTTVDTASDTTVDTASDTTVDTASDTTSNCVEGTTRCIENWVESCSSGQWTQWEDCSFNKETCYILRGQHQCVPCGADTIFENGACIGTKQIACIDVAPENAVSTIADVAITYTDAAGWSIPADCVWGCNEGYHTEDSTTCISNTKMVPCTNAAPANATSTVADVAIGYTDAAGWATAADCEWECNGDHLLDGAECVKAIIGDDWTTIAAGSFWMGSPDGDCPAAYLAELGIGSCVAELERRTDEPLHFVTLTHDFIIQRTEVTQGAFQKAMGWNPSHFGPNGEGMECGDTCPVEMLNWFETLAYANEVSIEEGYPPCYELTEIRCEDNSVAGTSYKNCMNTTQGGISTATVALTNGATTPYECTGFRLPTEAEWEYAVRAGSYTEIHPSASQPGTIASIDPDPNLEQIAWSGKSKLSYAGQGTRVVGQKEPNNWGLYDMSGNVWELVWDARRLDLGTEAVVDPVFTAVNGASVRRGGSWNGPGSACRSANRAVAAPNLRASYNGFRIARSVP